MLRPPDPAKRVQVVALIILAEDDLVGSEKLLLGLCCVADQSRESSHVFTWSTAHPPVIDILGTCECFGRDFPARHELPEMTEALGQVIQADHQVGYRTDVPS